MFVKPADINTNQTPPLLLLLQANRVYEETREDGRQSRSPPVEISSIYTVAIYKPNGVKTSDDYSFTAATASRPLNKVKKRTAAAF